MNQAENSDRRRILKELHHQMRYASLPGERDSIRRTIEFWQRRR